MVKPITLLGEHPPVDCPIYNHSMAGIEWRGVSPEEMVREIEATLKRCGEKKYAFQVGLKDLDFELDEDKITALGITLPFPSIDQAEQALREGVVTPAKFLEVDDTEHQVTAFDPRPVGYSGFMDCVTHSLALTDQGLFEVGRYPAVNLSSQNRYWQWFLHRRLATPEEVATWQQDQALSPDELLERVYVALTEVG
ncbi:MAG: hypothetical protein KAS36_16975 [Anaerolineales bacterium]|nr:hypothetical protein [Anaerolineales bacterium]